MATGDLWSGRVGLRNVGSYQVAGHPYITGSTNLDNNTVHLISFPYVSKAVTVINNNSNSGEDIRVHFQSGSGVTIAAQAYGGGAGAINASADVIKFNHYVTVPAGNGSVTFDVKCSKFYISNGSGTADLKYQVFAELTGIPTGSMYHLTGSGITEA
jgi:hypothetical protein